LLATFSFGTLLVLLPFFPEAAGLHTVLVLFGLTLFAQAVCLKWVFMGQEKMLRVSAGLLLAQLIFSAGVFVFVRDPDAFLLVPLFRLAADLALSFYFGRLFLIQHGSLRLAYSLRGTTSLLKRALPMGAAQGLALANYNLDWILIGFMLGTTAVGVYSAAYKPVTVVLAFPVSYFIGLFPALSRTFSGSPEVFHEIASRSLRLAAIVSIPLGVGLSVLAGPVIEFLFGTPYAGAVPALQILVWSAVLVILRGTYRQGLNAAGNTWLDLRCASASAALSFLLNLILIPRFGIIGAAVATLIAEILWLLMAWYYFYHKVMPIGLGAFLTQPIIAVSAMGVWLWWSQPLLWPVRGIVASLIYVVMMLLLHQTEVYSWLQNRKLRLRSGNS
jgi:O-antigen/teichoic acid export membrane protein